MLTDEDTATRWRKRWPNHCGACGGWGMWLNDQEQPTLCDARPLTQCHRCGAHALTPPGHCKVCLWDFDDGA